MPRKQRFYLQNIPAHVMQRGHNRDAVFFGEQDYFEYLKILKRVADSCGCAIHAYVLMTNHVHLLLTPDTTGAISRLFQDCGRQYVSHVNRTYHRRGTLWEGRHKGNVIESSTYLAACMRYIEMNPVRAGIVAHPEHYRWSSYRANALGEDNCILTAHEEYALLGPTPTRRQEMYRNLFELGSSPAELERIRNCTQSGTPMGSERFKAQIEKVFQRPVGAERRGRPARMPLPESKHSGI